MSFSFEYVRQLIVKVACDTTGDDAEEVLESGRLEIPPHDAIEFMVRLQATLDCVLCQLRYEPLSVEIDELAASVLEAMEAGDLLARRSSEV